MTPAQTARAAHRANNAALRSQFAAASTGKPYGFFAEFASKVSISSQALDRWRKSETSLHLATLAAIADEMAAVPPPG